jgi:hypothetical protein
MLISVCSQRNAFKRELFTMSDYIGLPGFIMRSAYNAAYPTQGSKQPVYLQGSRQMTSTSRAYYEKNLGAGYFMSMDPEHGFTGYTEPLRRFIQPESYAPQVNEISNQMPDWLPGEDYLINFQKGDPYIKVDEGYARLPGAGYQALHPELDGISPEDYPDIAKLRILGGCRSLLPGVPEVRGEGAEPGERHQTRCLPGAAEEIPSRVRGAKGRTLRPAAGCQACWTARAGRDRTPTYIWRSFPKTVPRPVIGNT